LGISLIASTIVFAILLTITFLIWFKREQTLSIKTVNSPSREGFYWLTILFTFALGTSAGDLFAEKFGIGFGNSFLIFIALILVITSLWRFKKLSEVSAFWACYILTRPLGASSGDFLSQAKKDGGLGLGASTTSWIYLAAILAIVGYLAVTKVDQIKN
jgi:uncharacterized membrane-anchored protein